MVKRQGQHVPNFLPITIPSSMMEIHKVNTLGMGNFYVNGNIFFHTILRKLQFRIVTHVKSWKKPVLLNKAWAIRSA